MSQARAGAASALLPDGRILITGGDGGSGALTSAEFFSPNGTATAAASMNVARSGHFALALSDGRVLVGGGNSSGGGATNSVEIYDPTADSWTQIGPMTSARANTSAALLQDGRILIAGGDNAGTPSNTIEIFDPSTGNFSFAGTLSSPRTKQAVAVLQDGRVLIVGGFDGTNALASSDIFDPSTGSVGAGPLLATPRYSESATTLLNGQVAVIGGATTVNSGTTDLSSAEVFDPATGVFANAGVSLTTAREGHQAFLLPSNNSVLVVGGTSGGQIVAPSELFVPQVSTADGSWSYAFAPTASNVTPRTAAVGSAMSQDGLLLVVGGKDASGNALASTELYAFPVVKTDATDYPPGTTVTISGSGFKPGEVVNITIVESPLIDTPGPFTATADGNGNFSNSSFTTDINDVNVRFWLTAVGSQSGLVAENTFTDGNVTSLSGTVRSSAAGNPAIVGATIRCTSGCNGTPSTTSGVGGAYSFSGANKLSFPTNGPVTLVLTAAAAGFNPGTITLNNVNNGNTYTNQDFSLTPAIIATTTDISAAGITYGANGSVSVTVSSSSGTPTGNVSLSVDTATAVSKTLSGGSATFTSSDIAILGAPSAGNHSLSANYSAQNGFGASSAAGTLIVNKATPTATATGGTFTYDGTAHAGSGTAMGVLNPADNLTPVTLSYSGVNGTVYGPSAIAPTNAGNYTVTASFAGDSNYNSANSSAAPLTIDKATATVVVTPYTVTYNGQPHTATVTSITGVNSETGPTVGTVDVSGTTHTNAATYSDSWSFTGTANYNNIAATAITDTINKANATVVVTPYTVTYNGQQHTATVTSITGVNSETGATVGTVDVSGTTHTNAATYSDSWSFTGTANYNNIAATPITDTINKADATVVVTPYTVTYNGQPHTATVTSITGVNSETGATVGTVDVSGTTHTNAATYSDSWSFTGTANYNNIAATAITDTINKANATVVVTPYTVTYNGQPHTATVTSITGVNSETGATVGTVDVSNTSHTNAGTYTTDSWTFTGTANYNNIAATTITDTINKANATVVVAPYTVTYDGSAHTATVTSITGVNGETGTTVGTVDVSSTTHTTAGTYSDSWTFEGAANYNNIAATPITDTINKATPNVNWANPSDIIYGTALSGTQLNATFTWTVAGSIVNVPGTATYTPGTGTVLNPGQGQTLTVNFTPSDTVDYKPNSGTVKINVVFATGRACNNGLAAGVILQPINVDGSSVFKAGSTVPTKFVVCDAYGNSVGPNAAFPNSNIVKSYIIAAASSGTVSGVDETQYSTTPDTYFRWDPTAQQWIFNQATGRSTNLTSVGVTYLFQITLIDGTVIGGSNKFGMPGYQFGLK